MAALRRSFPDDQRGTDRVITNGTKRDLGNKRNSSPAPPYPLSDREARSIDNGSERGL
jgi:hypothetical protein